MDKFRRAAERATKDSNRHGVLVASRDTTPIGFVYCNIGEPMVGVGLGKAQRAVMAVIKHDGCELLQGSPG